MILAILQARMSSTRLPGKVLKPLAGAPMILRQLERTARARRLDKIVVATSTEPADDAIEAEVAAAGVAVHRGPLDDVLGRFLGALDAFPAEHVVRLTADCPLTDPDVIDAVVARHLEAGCDYANNRPATNPYPKGQDVEVVTAAALRRAGAAAASAEEHEHVTWGIWNHPDRYRLAWLTSPRPDEGEVRWTVDTPDDYAFVAAVYDALYPANPAFTSDDVRALIAGRPDLAKFGGDRRI